MNAPEILKECHANGLQVFMLKGGLKASGNQDAIKKFVPLLKSRKLEIERHLLAMQLTQFRFDLIPDEIELESGYSVNDVNRVNNMAWEFMHWDGMQFSDAIEAACSIVNSCPAAICERAYVDSMVLFKRIKQSIQIEKQRGY